MAVKRKRKIRPVAPAIGAIQPGDLRRCDACGAHFGTEATFAAHAKTHVEVTPANRLISRKRKGAKPARANLGFFKGSSKALQGGAPGLGRK